MSAEPRIHRVTLCRLEFFKIEVLADDRASAFRCAEALQREARREFTTVPSAIRAEVLEPDRPHTEPPAFHWVEIRA